MLVETNQSSIGSQLKANQELNNKITYVLDDFKSTQNDFEKNELLTLKKENETLKRLFASKPVNLSQLREKETHELAATQMSQHSVSSCSKYNHLNQSDYKPHYNKKIEIATNTRDVRSHSSKKPDGAFSYKPTKSSTNSSKHADTKPKDNDYNKALLKNSIAEAKIKMADLLKGRQTLETKLHSIKTLMLHK